MPMTVTKRKSASTSQPNAPQNVRICHEKCDSRYVPRASERFA
jgi:hypothetical protein